MNYAEHFSDADASTLISKAFIADDVSPDLAIWRGRKRQCNTHERSSR